MPINSMIGGITNELVEYLYIQLNKKTNRKKLKKIFDIGTDIIFTDIKPYLYTILAILILMFIMNLVQFYYYIKLFIDSKSLIPNTFNIID
jgi:hypothetical protein